LLIGALVLALSSCGSNREAVYENVEISALNEQVSDLEARLAQTQAELEAARKNTGHDPSADLARRLAGSGANVRYRNGELIIGIANDILFSSGSAVLTSKAKSSLRQVANEIQRTYSSNYVRVEGHTDDQPIVRTKDKWSDNWHLSGARARSVLAEMIGLGTPKDRISFAGYADTQPLNSNSSKASRSNNRRVEIIILPVLPE
jgi:chemotaxis protein MotB